MSRRMQLVVGLIVVGTAVAGLGWLAISPWLLWHLLPSAPQRGVVVTAHLIDTPLALLAEVVVPPAIREYLPAASHLGWAQDGQQIQLVIVPRLMAYQSLSRALATSGWHVRSFGPLLIANKGDVRPRPLTVVLSGYIRSLTSSSWPVFPVAIVMNTHDPLAGVGSPLALVMTRRDKQVRLVVAPNLIEGRHYPTVLGAALSDEGVVTVPGEFIQALPAPVHENLNRLLRSSLGFTLTRPDILTQLAAYDGVSFILGPGEEVIGTLGVRGDTNTFVQTVTSWMQEEERRTRLTTRAFRLPDGTLGYEKIPGDILPVMTYATLDQCWHPVEGRGTLWLCLYNNSLGLGTSQSQARDTARAASMPTTYINLGVRALERVRETVSCEDQSLDIQTRIFCSLASLRLQGVPERVHIEFVLR